MDIKKLCADEQFIGFLKQAAAGIPAKQLCRKHGLIDASFHIWRQKFSGMAITILGGLLWRAVGQGVSLTRPMGGADPLDMLASHLERVDAAGGAIAEAAVRVAEKTRAALK